MLTEARAAAGGRRSRRKTTLAVRRRVPVRTFADWHEPLPGFVEADLVVHCGERMSGSFASTLVLTDIASGWTECIALLVRESSLIVDALRRLRVTLPFALRGIDTDNGLPSKSRERHETELLSADADVSTSNASPSGSHRRGITR
jgi:hypothetical protein